MPKPLLTELLGGLAGLTKQAYLAETLAGLGLIGAGVGIPMAYAKGQERARADERVRRLLAFGSGALSGYLAPKLLHRLSEKKLGVMDDNLPGLGLTDQLSELPGLADIPDLTEYSS